jgi:hypothetical protein
MMAPHKCNFIIFLKYNGDETSKLNLKLFNSKLASNDKPTFLGLRFDKSLFFKNQTKYLQDACLNRLNFLKIVSKRKYGLNKNTLEQLYISLVRSILEYSATLFPVISDSNFNKMNIIQKNSIKIINRKPIYTSMTEIDPDIENLYDRFDTLNKNYLINAIKNKNELVIELCSDFLDLVKHRIQKQCTNLCKYKDIISPLLTFI